VTLPFLGWMPTRANAPSEKSVEDKNAAPFQNTPVAAYLPWLGLAAIVVTYVNIGAYWTYIELAALAAEITPEWINQVLVWASFCSIVGCLFATLLSDRFGLGRPLMITLIMMSLIVGMLAFGITDTKLLVSVFTFNLLWIFIDVYQMSTVASVDRSGRFAALMPGAQGLGQIIGPNLAASLLGAELGYFAVFLMCSLAAVLGMLIYGVLYFALSRSEQQATIKI
ncbi:MAG: hypothetical protein ACPG4A_13420, partial [Pseudomonadales bacterium]